MKRLLPILFIAITAVAVHAQILRPDYVGESSWIKTDNQSPAEVLPVVPHVYPISRIVSPNKILRTIIQQKIDPATKIIHQGTIKPVTETIRFTGKKLGNPDIVNAPALLTRDNTAYNISYTDRQHGFAGANTTDFAEDDAHNIWIASENQLIRYDGYHYFLYNKKNGLPDLNNTSLLYDNQKRLWIASENGLYFLRNDSLFSIKSNEIDFSAIACFKVQADAMKRIWLSTKKNGAICIDGSEIQIFDKRCGLNNEYVMATHVDKKGNLFIASHDSGVVIIEPDKMSLLFSTSKNMKWHSFLSFYEDEDGVWAGGFQSGLMQMGLKDTIQYSISGNFDECIFDIKKAPGGLWLSAYGSSVAYFNKTGLAVFNESNGLLNNEPHYLFVDSYKNLWVSSYLRSGFSRINQNAFSIQDYEIPGIEYVSSVFDDNKKGRWILGSRLFYQKNNSITQFFYQDKKGLEPTLYPLDGLANDDGTLWTGSYGAGMMHVGTKNFTAYFFSDFSENRIVYSIKKDAANKVWFCPTNYGLIVYDKNKFWRYQKKSGLLANSVEDIFLDAEKRINLSFTNGLQRLNNNTFETFFIGKKNFNDQVKGLLVIDSVTSLLATYNSGLMLINQNKVFQFSTKTGLTSNTIKTIIKDKYGKIWISTDKGIESFLLNGTTLTEHRIFNQSDGSYILDAENVFLDPKGQPFWSFHKKKIVLNQAFLLPQINAPTLTITQIWVDEKIIAERSAVSILPNQKIIIKYTAIDWGRENSLDMKYLLISERGDSSINSIGEKGQISISDIQPGKYKILLIGKDSDQTYYASPILLHIKNFWYNTLLFRLLIIFSIIISMIAYFRIRSVEQKKINQLLEIRVASQTKEIAKEKEELIISNQMIEKQNKEKDILIEEINHRVKNNLAFIAAMIEMQLGNNYSAETIQALLGTSLRIKAMSLVHEMLYNSNDLKGLSIKKYIKELVDNLIEIAGDPQNPIRFNLEVDDIYIDSKSAIALGMIISELISNSFKHAFDLVKDPAIFIQLDTNADTGRIQLTVADNGNGIKDTEVSNKGLGKRLVDIFSRQLNGNYSFKTEGEFMYVLNFKPFES